MKEGKIFKKHGIFIDSFREVLSSSNGKQGQSSQKEIFENKHFLPYITAIKDFVTGTTNEVTYPHAQEKKCI